MMRHARTSALAVLMILFAGPALAADGPVHGIWVWKTATVLEPAGSTEALRDFCRSETIAEVYLSVSSHDLPAQVSRFVNLIDLLHRSNIRVEALLDSIDADKPGKPRDTLLEHVRTIVHFNEEHTKTKFDGIHLDIEPHQRPENKGAGNVQFLPDLIEAFRGVRALANPAGMTVNADIANKFLKTDGIQRSALLGSVDRVTLMLYELSNPDDGHSATGNALKLRHVAERFLAMAYDGLDNPGLARMAIALRTPDYGGALADMLKTLDDNELTNTHYLGWAWHSYNDHLEHLKN